jgi:hypothetical protein
MNTSSGGGGSFNVSQYRHRDTQARNDANDDVSMAESKEDGRRPSPSIDLTTSPPIAPQIVTPISDSINLGDSKRTSPLSPDVTTSTTISMHGQQPQPQAVIAAAKPSPASAPVVKELLDIIRDSLVGSDFNSEFKV